MSQGAVLGTKSDGEPHFHSRGLIKMGVWTPKRVPDMGFGAIFDPSSIFFPQYHQKAPPDVSPTSWHWTIGSLFDDNV